MDYFVEIRSLNIKTDAGHEFQRRYSEEALPLLQNWKFEVLAHGPSLHNRDTYYVVRSYDSPGQRDQMEDAYYASDAWRKGPRERMIELIESYVDIVFKADERTVQGLRGSGNHLLEVRSYNLKIGTGSEFNRHFWNEAFPLLQRWNVDVVAFRPSKHDQDTYYLMRRFDSLSLREESENSFYGSEAWRWGPRAQILAVIENYAEIVLALDESTVAGLRRDGTIDAG